MNFHKTDDYLTEATCVGTAFDGGKFVSRGMLIPSKAVAPLGLGSGLDFKLFGRKEAVVRSWVEGGTGVRS